MPNTLTLSTTTLDTELQEANKDTPAGPSNNIRFGQSSGNDRIAILEFNLTALPASSTVTSASITWNVNATSATSSTESCYIRRVTTTGIIEGTDINTGATWNHKSKADSTPWANGGAFSSSDYTADGQVSFNLSETTELVTISGLNRIIQDAFLAGTTLTLAIMPDLATNANSIDSKEKVGGVIPSISITYEELISAEFPQTRQTRFFDNFQYLGYRTDIDYDTAGKSLATDWTDSPSDSFTTHSERYLQALAAGEVVYVGTEVETTSGNYATIVTTLGNSGTIFEIRSRRSDANNYVALEVDYDNNRIRLKQNIAGSMINQLWVSHTLNDGSAYTFDLWTFETTAYAFANKGLVTSAAISSTTSPGFSININTFSDDTWFESVTIVDLVSPTSPQLDSDDLLVTFREDIKEIIETVDRGNYEQFKYVYQLYRQQKDTGRRHQNWNDLGYPIREPTTEEWLS